FHHELLILAYLAVRNRSDGRERRGRGLSLGRCCRGRCGRRWSGRSRLGPRLREGGSSQTQNGRQAQHSQIFHGGTLLVFSPKRRRKISRPQGRHHLSALARSRRKGKSTKEVFPQCFSVLLRCK